MFTKNINSELSEASETSDEYQQFIVSALLHFSQNSSKQNFTQINNKQRVEMFVFTFQRSEGKKIYKIIQEHRIKYENNY